MHVYLRETYNQNKHFILLHSIISPWNVVDQLKWKFITFLTSEKEVKIESYRQTLIKLAEISHNLHSQNKWLNSCTDHIFICDISKTHWKMLSLARHSFLAKFHRAQSWASFQIIYISELIVLFLLYFLFWKTEIFSKFFYDSCTTHICWQGKAYKFVFG